MGVLKFDGVNDFVLFNAASSALQAVPTGPKTLLAVFRRVNTTAAWNSIISLETSAPAYRTTMEIDTSHRIAVDTNVAGIRGTVVTQVANSTDYYMVAYTHNNAAVRIINKNLTTGATVTRESTGFLVNGSTLGSGGLVRFGMLESNDPAAIWLAVAAVWDQVLTDSQIDECWANKATNDIWWNSAGHPLVLVEFNTASPTDLGGNCAFSTTSGAVIDAAETAASWNFNGTTFKTDNTTKPTVAGQFNPQIVQEMWF